MQEKFKILIGDDSREFGLYWASLLKAEGMYAITRKRNGRAILDTMIEKGMPDLLIVDTVMSDMDAMAFMREMRDLSGRTPVTVVVSDYDSPLWERELLEAGADSFLIKSLAADEIVKKCKTLCRFRNGKFGDRSGKEYQNVELVVTDLIRRFGVPANIKGYYYLRTAILMSLEDESLLGGVTKQLYPSVAEYHGTTPTRAERAIRHGIEVAWERGDDTAIALFGGKERKKPTNSEFIAMISDRLRLEYGPRFRP
ncbi:MAG: response regulator [Bacteroides sp.]|nr:response regulator [Eubacterium sp.]MCM1417900.1 response regulator [Roseburia sp.]MCM1461936.1 response regulator [Bacteroides sp.]